MFSAGVRGTGTSMDQMNHKMMDDQPVSKGGVAVPFPWRLHQMLQAVEEEGMQDIVSWADHGRAFTVRKPKEFVSTILVRKLARKRDNC